MINRLTVLTRTSTHLFTFLLLRFENVGLVEHIMEIMDEVNLKLLKVPKLFENY
jgi:hypothetical protein